ncbi:hypothetical protein BGZ60DRAFT_527155 [Tricladium varicosporioides]|nr:hypothetical protein BGZ60DRAFT_527155 [Hymenoscyphus varicosporioides]
MQFITIITVLFATVSSVIAIPSPSEQEMNAARDLGTSIAERSIGSTICKGACAVACNSTVLALAQTKCLEVCNAKC